MTARRSVLVTGATGTIGAPLLELLADQADCDIRAATRQPLEHRSTGRVTWVPFDWDTPAGAGPIVAGVDAVVVIPPSARHPLPAAAALLDAARSTGARYVVFVSTLGADFQPGFAFGRWDLEGEHAVAAGGVPYTAVRPNSYMSNFFTMLRPDGGALRLPWGQGSTSFVDPGDVAAVVAELLRQPGSHSGCTYELTGPEALDGVAIEGVLNATIGGPVRCEPISLETAAAEIAGPGVPPPMVSALVELHAAMADSSRSYVTDHVQRVIGRAPGTFAAFAGRWAGRATSTSTVELSR